MLSPMLCKVASKPLAYYQDTHLAEWKWDGTRVLAFGTDKFHLINRRGVDYTKRLPEITQAFKNITTSFILDGEIVHFDKNGRTIFTKSQRRCATSTPRKIYRLMHEIPIHYLVWDILHLDGRNLQRVPYIDRKEILLEFFKTHLYKETTNWTLAQQILYVPHYTEIKQAYEKAIAQGEEGLILKLARSPYQEGTRSPYWLKYRPVKTVTVNVIGFTEGTGKFQGYFGALVLQREGRYCGKAGSGGTHNQRQAFTEQLRQRANGTGYTPKGEQYTTIKPVMVQVMYYEVTENGVFRFPVWKPNTEKYKPKRIGLGEKRVTGSLWKNLGRKA